MKTLTILQPWVWAIFHAGKTVENRKWKTPYRGPLAIHAGLNRKLVNNVKREVWERVYHVPLPPPDDFIFGAIIGQVELVDCLPDGHKRIDKNVWARGPWNWLLRNPVIFPKPIIVSGKLGLWEWKK